MKTFEWKRAEKDEIPREGSMKGGVDSKGT